MTYAATHQRARAQLRKKGARITFTLTSPGTYNEAADTWSAPTTVTVSGYAVKTGGNPRTYERLTLIESQAPTLLFTGDSYGQEPPLGAVVSWGGENYTVRDVDTIAPDGPAIVAYVVIA